MMPPARIEFSRRQMADADPDRSEKAGFLETEYKRFVDKPFWDAVARFPKVSLFGIEKTDTFYYDTEAQDLRWHGVFLRTRAGNATYTPEISVKGSPDKNDTGIMRRSEHERPSPDFGLHLALLPEPAREMLLGATARACLDPADYRLYFITHVTRAGFIADIVIEGRAAQAEVVADHCIYRAPTRDALFGRAARSATEFDVIGEHYEIEAEIKNSNGYNSSMQDAALHLAWALTEQEAIRLHGAPLWSKENLRSKADLGFQRLDRQRQRGRQFEEIPAMEILARLADKNDAAPHAPNVRGSKTCYPARSSGGRHPGN